MNGQIRGTVMTMEKEPVAGASVVVEESPGPVPDIAPMSDDQGEFVLGGLASGRYVLKAFGPNGEVGTGMVEVSSNMTVRLEIEVEESISE